MRAKLGSWLQKNKQLLITTTVVILIVLFVFALAVSIWGWDWTGFTRGESKMTTTPQGTNTEYTPSKTLWDWLSLLFVPGVLTLGAIWFTAQQNHDRDIAEGNQHENTLQVYIDNMSVLLLEKDLRNSNKEDEVRQIAHVRTETTFSRLDPERKGRVLHFLYASNLIMKDTKIIDLKFADLSYAKLAQFDKSNADLSETNLSNANLSGAILIGTDLSGAKLQGANMSGVDLSRANLSGADLSEANLRDAMVTSEQLAKAKSLKGATMPDGIIHS